MHCAGANMTYVPNGVKHGDYDAGNIHWRDGYHFDMLYPLFKRQFLIWSKPGSRIAIWICTGSWDYSFGDFRFSVKSGLYDHLKRALLYLKDHQRNCRECDLSIHLLTTPPMPKKHHWNNISIQAFNSIL